MSSEKLEIDLTWCDCKSVCMLECVCCFWMELWSIKQVFWISFFRFFWFRLQKWNGHEWECLYFRILELCQRRFVFIGGQWSYYWKDWLHPGFSRVWYYLHNRPKRWNVFFQGIACLIRVGVSWIFLSFICIPVISFRDRLTKYFLVKKDWDDRP